MLDFAIPSKGRLQEDALAFLNRIGAALPRAEKDRAYRLTAPGLPDTTVWLLSSDEIARRLHAGDLHAGLVGEDLLREYGDVDADIAPLCKLGFGHADLVAAVPAAWIDVQTPADLKDVFHDIRLTRNRAGVVATKYVRQTLAAFRAWGIEDFRIARSHGATEAAPANGGADIIVDIITTGETLRANRLRPLSGPPILKSEVNIAASVNVGWSEPALSALERILERQAAAAARAKFLRFSAPANPEPVAEMLRTAYGATLTHVVRSGEAAVYVQENQALDAAADLRRMTNGPVSIFAPNYVFNAQGEALARLRALIRTN
jgi:ATP phosphoribosyltransferase